MQLCLRDGDVQYKDADSLEGCLHWIGQSLEIKGEIKWVKGNRFGVAFQGGEPLYDTVRSLWPIQYRQKYEADPFFGSGL